MVGQDRGSLAKHPVSSTRSAPISDDMRNRADPGGYEDDVPRLLSIASESPPLPLPNFIKGVFRRRARADRPGGSTRSTSASPPSGRDRPPRSGPCYAA